MTINILYMSMGCRLSYQQPMEAPIATQTVFESARQLLYRIARTTYVDAAYCYRLSSVVCLSVCHGPARLRTIGSEADPVTEQVEL